MTSLVELTVAAPNVAVVTLNDPDRRNVLSAELIGGLCAALDEAEAVESVSAVVIAARGPAFCAGARLDTLLSAADGDFAPVEAVYEGFLRVMRSPLLTAAAVDGPAVGAGLNLALACDLRFAGPRARFDTRFARLRLHPGGGHLWLLQRAVGYQRAAAACLLSEAWDAESALRDGLVLAVEDDPAGAATARLAAMAGLERDLARRMVASLRAEAELPVHGDALELETRAQRWSTTLPGFVTGVRAMQAGISGRR
ncbi:enoyl-CoA hydratase-related protein [Dactylosporangium sp. CA-092794]|uniref:enoyl-CoA hydratase-related protein n=1 Tax=Dactylosporangium sp. CA-092794 TaxID=3239929 RepID=UPI003D90A67C